LVEEAALAQAEAECLADSDVRARRQQRAAAREAELDRHYVERFSARVRTLFPGCPPDRERLIGEHACFYTDMAHGGNYWTFISEELPMLARSFFPLAPQRESNFVAGLSMGGYGAFKWALSHPERFAAAASLSGPLDLVSRLNAPQDPERLAERQRIFGDLKTLEGSANDLYALARAVVSSGSIPPQSYPCCGTEDALQANNVGAKTYFQSLGLALTYEQGPGAHEWGYWDEQIQRVLAWLPLGTEPEG